MAVAHIPHDTLVLDEYDLATPVGESQLVHEALAYCLHAKCACEVSYRQHPGLNLRIIAIVFATNHALTYTEIKGITTNGYARLLSPSQGLPYNDVVLSGADGHVVATFHLDPAVA